MIKQREPVGEQIVRTAQHAGARMAGGAGFASKFLIAGCERAGELFGPTSESAAVRAKALNKAVRANAYPFIATALGGGALFGYIFACRHL